MYIISKISRKFDGVGGGGGGGGGGRGEGRGRKGRGEEGEEEGERKSGFFRDWGGMSKIKMGEVLREGEGGGEKGGGEREKEGEIRADLIIVKEIGGFFGEAFRGPNGEGGRKET